MNLGLSLSLAARAVRAITKVNKKTGLLSIKVGAEVRMVPWVPTGDWSFKATVNPTVPGCHFLSSENSEGRLAIADSGVIAGKNISPANFGDVLTYGFDGSQHTIKIEQVGTTLSAYVDGELRGQAEGFTLDVGTVDRMFAKWGGATSVPPFYGTVEDITLSADGLSDRIYALELVGEDIQPDSALPDEPLILAGVDHDIDWVLDNPVAEPEPAPNPTTNDSVSLLMNEALIIDVADTILANDVGWGAGALTASIASQPANGTLVDNADGTWTYTPDADYSGADSATVSVTDGSNTATSVVYITVIDASSLPAVAAVTLQTPATPVDGELVTLDVVNAGIKPINDEGTHAPKILWLGATQYVDGIEQTIEEIYDAPQEPAAQHIDIRVDPANEYYLPKSSGAFLDGSEFEDPAFGGDGTNEMPLLYSPAASRSMRHDGNMGPSAVLVGRGMHLACGPMRGRCTQPVGSDGMFKRPASVPVGGEKLYAAFRASYRVDPMSYVALECASDPSVIFSEGDKVLIDVTTGSGAGSVLEAAVLGVFNGWLHVSVDEYNGGAPTTALSGGTGEARRNNEGDNADYAAVTLGWTSVTRNGSTKMMRFRTKLSQSNADDGTNLFGGSATHHEMYVGIDSERLGGETRIPISDHFIKQYDKEGLDKNVLIEVVYMRGFESRMYMDGKLIMKHLADEHDLIPDAYPGASLFGMENSNGGGQNQRFQEFVMGEMTEDISPARVFVADHGDLSQATHVERQFVTDWQRTEANKIKFKLSLGEFSDPSNLWVFVFDDNDSRSRYGTNLATGVVYNPAQVGPRNFVRTLGGSDYFRYAGDNVWLSATDVWHVTQDMRFGATPEGNVLFSRSDLGCVFEIQANGKINVAPVTGAGGRSDDTVLGIFDGKWWQVRAWSDGTDCGLTCSRYKDNMTGFDGTTLEVVIPGGACTMGINYLQRHSTTYTKADIANININDERRYVLSGPVTADEPELGGGAPLRQLNMTTALNLVEGELAPPAIG